MKKIFSAIPLALLALSSPLCGNDLASLLVPVAQLKAEAVSAEKAGTPAPEVTAKPAPAIFVAREDILAGLAEALAAHFSVDGKLGIDTPQIMRPIRVKDSSWRVDIVRVTGTALAPRMNVTFRILCDKESQGEIQIPVTCTLMREVLVANRRVERSTTANKSDYDVQARDVLDSSMSAPVPIAQDLDQYEIKGNIGQGQVLLWRDIELKPTLRRGQVVEAVANEGFMHVAIKAMALEDGRKGDVINVRNLSSNKDIQARIINERTVQVYF